MKYLKIIIFFILTLSFTNAFSADDHSLMTSDVQNYLGYGAIVFVLLLFTITLMVMLGTLKVLTRVILKTGKYTEAPVLIPVKPARSMNKSRANWFMYLLIPTLGIMGIYLLFNYFSGAAQLQEDKNPVASEKSDVAKNAGSNTANLVDENTVKLVTTPAVLDSGKAIFQTSCAACHGDKGQGIVGPNLTDDYWVHGGKINEVFKTVKYGVLDKGMPAWDKQLSAQKISDVANYIESLHGTNPPGAKAPQGAKEVF
jgi:cytochrome c oxidase cbb3-type subunit 3